MAASESSTNLVGQWGRKDSGVDVSSHQDHVWMPEKPKFEMCVEESTAEQNPDESPMADDQSSVGGQNESDCQRMSRRFFPPRGPVAKWLTWTIVCALIVGMVWSIAPRRMIPGDSMFGLVLTVTLCFIAEALIVKIPMCKDVPPLPKLLASLLMGLMLANLPAPANIASYIDPKVSWTLRTMALSVILTRAGLELDPEAMERVKWAVIRLAFLPCLAETTAIGIFGHYILGFPFVWSFMMGFLIAAVSPAVVIPSLILLQEKGLGRDKGVPSLVMAASGIDDVLAIAGFTVLLGIAMPNALEEEIVDEVYGMMSYGEKTEVSNATPPSFTNATMNYNMTTAGPEHYKPGLEIAGAVVEVVIGVVAGLACGYFISYIPPKNMRYKNFCRGALLLGIGIFAVFASDHWGIPGSGALWALITSFVASLHWKEDCKPLESAWHYMWLFFQPILFGLTGATVDVGMMDGETVGLGLAVLGIGLIFRMLVSSSVTWGLNFRIKEKMFVTIAWIPKGTVQAALGSAALDTALALDRPANEVRWSEQILVLAVLVTLITAPAGAFGISISGPKLLTASEPEAIDNPAFNSDGESGSSESGIATESSDHDHDHEEKPKERYISKDSEWAVSDENEHDEDVTSI